LAIEAGELQQTMLWKTDAEVEVALGNTDFMVEFGDELADVVSFTLLLAHDLGLDPATFFSFGPVRTTNVGPFFVPSEWMRV